MKIALIGNPNTGKSTLFNQLTNNHEYTSNYCGVTTTSKESNLFSNHTLVDLPGIYSLDPYSSEEIYTKEYLTNENIDCILNVIDINHIERNLFLTLQLIQLNIPVVLAINMMDEFKGTLNLDLLEKKLGIKCIPISAKKNINLDKLKLCLLHKSNHKINELNHSYEDIELLYLYIDSICDTCIQFNKKEQTWIDTIVLHPILAYPCLLLLLFIIFSFTFGKFGQGILIQFEIILNFIKDTFSYFIIQLNIHKILQSFISQGILVGIFSVLRFIPTILVLNFFFALLDETGYMARISILMDTPLKKIGLSGKCFFPLFIGFGCSVPAILATRSIHSRKEKILTILLISFISCSAKIPIYFFICHSFFQRQTFQIILFLYIFSILFGCFLLTMINKEPSTFVMELPEYKLPHLKSIFSYVFEKCKEFITRTFTIIYISSIVIWFLQHFDLSFHLVNDPSISILAFLLKQLSFLFIPLGFSDWRIITSLISGLSAKEVIVSTLSILVPNNIHTIFTPLSAYSFMIFVLLYSPCISSIAAIKKELGYKYAFFIFLFQSCLAWLISFLVFQILSMYIIT